MSMDKKKWDIPYPSDDEINEQVALIVKRGIRKQPRFIQSLLDMKRDMGWQYLLINRGEAIFSGLLMLIVISYMFLAKESAMKEADFYGLLFIISPLVFLGLIAYDYLQKKMNNTFELEMTMKHTVFQLLAVRMLVFSSLAILINMTFVLVFSLRFDFDILHGTLLSMTGLFVFSSSLLFVLRKGNFLKRGMFFIAGWVLVNTSLILIFDNHYGAVLHIIPNVVYGLLLAISLWLYLISLRTMFNRKEEEAWI